ncbi:hypothetical protein ACFVZX_42695, partial [Streptomyces erythrochromogenes]
MSILPGPGWWAGLPPAAGAAVMATGIISVALHMTGHETSSLVALVIAVARGGGRAGDITARRGGGPARGRAEAAPPA